MIKRSVLLVFLICSTSIALWAQKEADSTQLPKPASSIPDKVRAEFSKSHPNAIVNGWYKEKKNYKVIYREPPALQELLVYEKDGSLLRRETELATDSFPPAIVDYYRTHFPDEKTYVVWVSHTQNGTSGYYSPVNEYTLYFDKDGTFIRKEKRIPNELLK